MLDIKLDNSTHTDSKLEEKWTPLLKQLGFIILDKTFQQCGAAPYTDATGTPFNAKGDYYHQALNLFIELKGHALNHQPDIASCESGLRDQINFHLTKDHRTFSNLNTLHNLRDKRSYIDHRDYGSLSQIMWNSPKRRDSLYYAWNHSVYKQKIIQDAILAGGSRSEVWFANTGKEQKISVASAKTYGINAKAVGIRLIKSMLKTGKVEEFKVLLEDSFTKQ